MPRTLVYVVLPPILFRCAPLFSPVPTSSRPPFLSIAMHLRTFGLTTHVKKERDGPVQFEKDAPLPAAGPAADPFQEVDDFLSKVGKTDSGSADVSSRTAGKRSSRDRDPDLDRGRDRRHARHGDTSGDEARTNKRARVEEDDDRDGDRRRRGR